MRNPGLDEAQAEIKIAGRNINVRYADDTTFMAESEEKAKIMASSPIISVQFSLVTQSSLTLWEPMNCSTPGLPVYHQLTEFNQTYVH